MSDPKPVVTLPRPEALKVLLSPEDYAALGVVDEGVPS